MSKSSGFFVTLEGIEGSGKSSLIASLASWLSTQQTAVTVTREPGGTTLGKKIRELLLHHSGEPLSQIAELLLFSADRAQHVAQVLRPALAQGQLVLCDRYIHSTLAYQGSARGISREVLDTLLSLSTDNLVPDLVLLLDLDPETGLKRARRRESSGEQENSWSRFEAEELSFHLAVRNGFLKLAADDPQRFVLLNAALPQEAVLQAAQAAILERRAKQW